MLKSPKIRLIRLLWRVDRALDYSNLHKPDIVKLNSGHEFSPGDQGGLYHQRARVNLPTAFLNKKITDAGIGEKCYTLSDRSNEKVWSRFLCRRRHSSVYR